MNWEFRGRESRKHSKHRNEGISDRNRRFLQEMGTGQQIAGFILAGGASSRMGRDKALLELGGNIFFVLKIAAVDGRPTQSVAASFAGQTSEEYAAMMRSGGRNPVGIRSISGRF